MNKAPQFHDQISIRDMTVQGIVGTKKERRSKQNIIINLFLTHDVTLAGRTDDVAHTISYQAVYKAVEQYVQVSAHYTLESLALGIGRICCLEHNAYEVEVRVSKPSILPLARYPTVTIRRTRQFYLEAKSQTAERVPQPNECKLPLNHWLNRIKLSPTHAIKRVADELKKQGKVVYDFGIGEMNPYIPVPMSLRKHIAEAQLDEKYSCYSPARGDPMLLEAISVDFKRFNQHYAPSQIVVCPGPKDAITKACMALLNSEMTRNRVVTFAPSYEAFENLPVIVSGQPAVVLPTDKNFLPDPEQLRRTLAADPTIGVIIIGSPNNPTGVVYPPALLKALADVISDYPEVAVISDEVYRTIVYEPFQPGSESNSHSSTPLDVATIAKNYVSIAHYLPNQTLVVTGISKECSGTGIRLGWVAGPEPAARAIENVQGQTTSCVNLPVQIGVARFLIEDYDFKVREEIRKELEKRRHKTLTLFSTLPNLKKSFEISTIPTGAFYFFANVSPFLKTRIPQQRNNDDVSISTIDTETETETQIETEIETEAKEENEEKIITTDKDLALYLLNAVGIATIPGSEFLRPGHLRLALARDEEMIEQGLKAMDEALGKLVPMIQKA